MPYKTFAWPARTTTTTTTTITLPALLARAPLIPKPFHLFNAINLYGIVY